MRYALINSKSNVPSANSFYVRYLQRIQNKYNKIFVDDDSVCIALQEKEMEKQKILYQQARLHARGAAEMVLQMISASKGNDELIISQLNSLLGNL